MAPISNYRDSETDDEAKAPLRGSSSRNKGDRSRSHASLDSSDSNSTTSLILERLNPGGRRVDDGDEDDDEDGDRNKDEDYGPRNMDDEEAGLTVRNKPMERKVKKMIWIIGALLIGAWVAALGVYITREYYRSKGDQAADPEATGIQHSGKKIDLDQVMGGMWQPRHHRIDWIASSDGADGLMLEQDAREGFLVVKDVEDKTKVNILMKDRSFKSGNEVHMAQKVWPSHDLKNVLVLTGLQSNFRHSFTGVYWLYNIEKDAAEPLWPTNPDARCALAVWSPTSNGVVFVYKNNMYLRSFPGNDVVQITKDGGPELFYGIPDWVYEEEVFSGNTGLWWSEDSKYIAFLRTNESQVPDYPIQYFVSRPSGKQPSQGLKNYPEERLIKYPKAGAPNPVVDIQFFDVAKNQIFTVNIENDFSDAERLITEIVWAGPSKVLVRETNRESDVLKMVLVDVTQRTGKIVREVDINAIDGGWLEVTEQTTYIPADAANGRSDAGYIESIVHEGNDHIGYFTPLDNPDPIVLTKGDWEVVDGPSAVDLKEGLVYFMSTERSPIERHLYSVKLDGTEKRALTNDTASGFHAASFSKGAGYALISYDGPNVPWQKVISTKPGSKYQHTIETNEELSDMTKKYELPTKIYSTIDVDGFKLQTVERRPPHFNPKLKYPVLFQVYGGPGSQQVSKKFNVDFQSYVAAALGYVVVTVDGRGTGFIGRKARVAVRGKIGVVEAHDQIAAAKIWAKKKYVDAKKIAIWGWSYGGFMTLKTLEQDGGRTFSYGMAVAPVTDWAFYDSIYTERYMHTPQHNPDGYRQSAINNVTALGENVRFLMMHGTADDNVHFQNSLTLLDKLDLNGIENYDVHVFPDSDHSIYFHNANRMVYDRLATWLVAAFNGHFYLLDNEKPIPLEKAPPSRL